MIKIHFISGKVQEAMQDWVKFPSKLQMGGIRLLRAQENVLIPLNSSTIEYIEYVPDVVEEVEDEVEMVSDEPEEREVVADVVEEPAEPEVQPEVREETPEEANNRKIAEMMAKSDCHKNKHEGHVMNIYYQETLVGKSKAKARRYFPVCPFCGVRERYVKASTLTDEQKENAKAWDN